MAAEMIRKILAWCVVLAAVAVVLGMIVYALTTYTGRIVLATIGCTVLWIALVSWALSEVTGW